MQIAQIKNNNNNKKEPCCFARRLSLLHCSPAQLHFGELQASNSNRASDATLKVLEKTNAIIIIAMAQINKCLIEIFASAHFVFF
jgi:hypothetical protein